MNELNYTHLDQEKKLIINNKLDITYLENILFSIFLISFIFILGFTIFQKNNPKLINLKKMINNPHWWIITFFILLVCILVYFIPIHTKNLAQLKRLSRIQEAVLIGFVLFLTSFLTNLGFTASLFFIGGILWFLLRVNILSPVDNRQGISELDIRGWT